VKQSWRKENDESKNTHCAFRDVFGPFAADDVTIIKIKLGSVEHEILRLGSRAQTILGDIGGFGRHCDGNYVGVGLRVTERRLCFARL
jgi:hypothetical protein